MRIDLNTIAIAALLVASPILPLHPILPLQQRVAQAETVQEQKAEANRLLTQGYQQYQISQVEAAVQSWQQALKIYRAIQDRSGEEKALSNLGLAYHALGDYPKAIEHHQQRLVFARATQDRSGEGKALLNLGNTYRILGDYPKATQNYQQSLAIARELKSRSSQGKALGNLGLVYRALGDYAKAIEYHQQDLAIARELKDRLGEGNSLGNLGLVYRALGDYAKAIEYHQQRLAIARELKDRRGEGQSLGNLGVAYSALEDYPKAIDYHQQSLAIKREIKDRLGEGQSLGNLGTAYYNLEDYPQALEYHQQFLTIARELKNRLGEGRTLSNLGLVYHALGDYPKALEYYQQHLAIARELKDRVGEGSVLNNLGLTHHALKDPAKAEVSLFAALQIWESLRPGLSDENKISLFETQADSYRLLQQALIAQNKIDAALEVSERGRSRAFVELLTQRLQKSGSVPETIQPLNLQQIRQIAQAQNATLVQYSTLWNQSLYIWVIQPTGEMAFRQVDLKPILPKDVSLEKYVRTVRSEALGARGLGVIATAESPPKQTALQDLHQLLIQPIASLLPTNPNSRVIFVPQGALFLVPFAALRSTDGKYLIEQHTILTVASIQVLELTRQKKNTREKVTGTLIVGNPTMPKISFAPGEEPEQLPELPGAETEAKAIAQFLQAPALTGDRATKSVVKAQMQTARLVHLATHGLLDDQRGIGSAIALAPSGTDNGLLTAEEILDLKLNADLVVLSACDTGRGKITGDGVIGLSRSLISAGVPSVIVSLWAVPDAPTAALMTQFYQNLQRNPDKAQALRQAMLTTMQQHPSPRDWAAFTLIGEAE